MSRRRSAGNADQGAVAESGGTAAVSARVMEISLGVACIPSPAP